MYNQGQIQNLELFYQMESGKVNSQLFIQSLNTTQNIQPLRHNLISSKNASSMKAHILHTIGNHVYYTLQEDQTKAIYKMEVSRNMLVAACDTFIGGSVMIASTEQKQEVIKFFHRIQGEEMKQLDLLAVAQMAEAVKPMRIRRTKEQMINQNGYTFA